LEARPEDPARPPGATRRHPAAAAAADLTAWEARWKAVIDPDDQRAIIRVRHWLMKVAAEPVVLSGARLQLELRPRPDHRRPSSWGTPPGRWRPSRGRGVGTISGSAAAPTIRAPHSARRTEPVRGIASGPSTIAGRWSATEQIEASRRRSSRGEDLPPTTVELDRAAALSHACMRRLLTRSVLDAT
jgi:hypothetical protein